MLIEDVGSLLVRDSATVRDALERINSGNMQIALVVNTDAQLVGTVTDGDIRRALLSGIDLEDVVAKAMQGDFISLSTEDATMASALMRRHRVNQVPVLAPNGTIRSMYLDTNWQHTPVRQMPVLLMAGGQGKRLRPLTSDTPKPMIPVRGKPILEHVLQKCVAAGFQEFWLSVHYLKDQIQDYFGDGSAWQVSIRYLEEEQPMGTAGALTLLPERPATPTLVMNGDVLTSVDLLSLLDFHESHSSAATVCVREHITQIPYGAVVMEDMHVLSLEEKPVIHHYVNAGIYVLNPEVLDLLPSAEESTDMPNLLEKAIRNELPVTAFPVHEYWLDVGHPETLERANEEWA